MLKSSSCTASCCKYAKSASGVRVGSHSKYSAATPATWGTAMEVPDLMAVLFLTFLSEVADRMSTPGLLGSQRYFKQSQGRNQNVGNDKSTTERQAAGISHKTNVRMKIDTWAVIRPAGSVVDPIGSTNGDPLVGRSRRRRTGIDTFVACGRNNY
jgi:hypothetical protein